MSRRYSRTDDYNEIQINPEPVLTGEVAWTDEMWCSPGYPWHRWQDAWAETTTSVTERVWHKQGARMYALHRDKLLRDDLHSWLLVEAQLCANSYVPTPSVREPEKYWAGYLTGALTQRARYHFEEAVGSRYKRPEAALAHDAGIASTEALDEKENERGARVERRALHGHDPMARDPAAVVIHLEDLARENRDIGKYLRDNGTYSTSTVNVKGATCNVNLCTRPAVAHGLCGSHYNAERRKQSEDPCSIPGCDSTRQTRGVCHRHYNQYREGRMQPELEQYIEPVKRVSGRTCDIEGCDRRHNARGLCQTHYSQWLRDQRAAS